MASTTKDTPTSITSQTLQFPQEIIDLFIDYLYQELEIKEAGEALVACTLVSRSFSASARRCLWSTLVISERVSSRQIITRRFGYSRSELEPALYLRLSSLRLLLESQSGFRSFIRIVRIEVGPVIHGDPESTGLRSVVDGLISRAKNMDTLWITRMPGALPMNWPYNKPTIAQPLITLLSSVKFTHLRIEDVNDFPNDILKRCSSIRSLQLVAATFKQKNGSQSPTSSHASSQTLQLDELMIQYGLEGAYREISQSNISLSKLKTFQAYVSSLQEASIVQKLIKEGMFSLISLELTVRVDMMMMGHAGGTLSTFAGGHIDLGQFPKLLNLRLHIRREHHTLFQSLEDTFSLLNPITHPTRLESIDITVNHQHLSAVSKALHLYHTNDAPWTLLEPSVLRKKHPHLRRLFIKLNLGIGSSPQVSNSEKRDVEQSLQKFLQSIIFPSSSSSSVSNSTVASLGLEVVVL
ncbi:hypothetical protein GALMADRAFT_132574 [Galerina marginata CBS 339.88]|uniref:F-box domain-containing protein n=1 Tax=Galerina marginata (strain CBS 339.88) TaxID=685588 RepID=A0A067TUH5_GALM3|nr:hypothetical protein GALMADRAFT_132574 [Galerina marginata CBS 339.88]